MEKYFRLNALYDCYGVLLTERQRLLMEQYLTEDLSLGEIAEREGISRQGVRDALARAGEQLEEYEKLLAIYERDTRLVKRLAELEALVEDTPMEHDRREKIKEQIRCVVKTMEITDGI